MESFDEGCQDFPVLMVEELQAKLEQIRDEKWPQWNVPRVRVVLHWEHILCIDVNSEFSWSSSTDY
tara:strand:- start:2134 stop:2331 length:198 start_codon:yes stop_codon:yes gene_type:complete